MYQLGKIKILNRITIGKEPGKNELNPHLHHINVHQKPNHIVKIIFGVHKTEFFFLD